jgi:hypothetical protein
MTIEKLFVPAIIIILSLSVAIFILFMDWDFKEHEKICEEVCRDHNFDMVRVCRANQVYCLVNDTLFNASGTWLYHAIFTDINGSWVQTEYRYELINPKKEII